MNDANDDDNPVKPIAFDVLAFLTVQQFGAHADLSKLPDHIRPAMRRYLADGIMPGHSMRMVLEGNIQSVRLFRQDLPALLALVDWLHDDVPAACWGSPDQVQLWIATVRRRARPTPLAAE